MGVILNTSGPYSRPRASRREFLRFGLGVSLSVATGLSHPMTAASADSPSNELTTWLRHPLLVSTLYRHAVSSDYAPSGAAGANRIAYRWIEEQRQGAEWIVRGYAERRPEWLALGWRELNWGIARQQPDGGFASEDPFHSTSLFVEALARSCLIDAGGASLAHTEALHRAAQWLSSTDIETIGARNNAPYTHRRYVLAAALGQTAAVTGDARLAAKAADWANQGMALQRPDGANPEKGGFDASYQMVGALMALRYWPVCRDSALRMRLATAIRRAIMGELARQKEDGSIDAGGSTRVGAERARSGKIKEVNYAEVLQALVFASQGLGEPSWLDAARKIAVLRQW